MNSLVLKSKKIFKKKFKKLYIDFKKNLPQNALQYLCTIFRCCRPFCLSVTVYADWFADGHTKVHLCFIIYIDVDNFLINKLKRKIWPFIIQTMTQKCFRKLTLVKMARLSISLETLIYLLNNNKINSKVNFLVTVWQVNYIKQVYLNFNLTIN